MSSPGLPLPAFAHKWPAEARVRVGERGTSKTGKQIPTRRFHFDLALELGAEMGSREQGGKVYDVQYRVCDKLMVELAATRGLTVSRFGGELCFEKDDKPEPFRPRAIPIEFLSDDPSEWLEIRQSRWRKAGPECLGTDYRPKTPEELADPEARRAAELQGLNPDPSPSEAGRCPLYWTGSCERITYDAQGRQTARDFGTCDPLTCPHFWPQDDTVAKCKPEVNFHFLLPWATRWQWAWFHSTGSQTAAELATSVAKISGAVGGRLGGLEVLLVTRPARRTTPKRERQLQPIVFVAPGRSFRALREDVSQRLALEAGHERPMELPATKATTEALTLEFHGAREDEPGLVRTQEDFVAWALSGGHTVSDADDAWIESGGDFDAAVKVITR